MPTTCNNKALAVPNGFNTLVFSLCNKKGEAGISFASKGNTCKNR